MQCVQCEDYFKGARFYVPLHLTAHGVADAGEEVDTEEGCRIRRWRLVLHVCNLSLHLHVCSVSLSPHACAALALLALTHAAVAL